MGRKKKESAPGISADFLALVTFSDLMTLCLTFFVLLFSMSEIKTVKMKATMRAFMAQFGVLPRQTTSVQVFESPQRVMQTESSILRRGPLGRHTNVVALVEDEKTRIVIGGKTLFEPENSTLLPEGKRILEQEVAPDLKGYRNRIEIRGHTASILRKDVDATHLAYLRAESVARHLVSVCAIDPRRLRVISCSDNEPVGSNQTPEGREANRRVEIIMTEELVRDAGEQNVRLQK